MRLDKRFYTLTAMAAIALGACRSNTPDAGDSGMAPPAAKADSAPSSGAAPTATSRSDSVLLKTDKAQYKAGEQIALTFENKSAASYAFNPCQRSVEREEGSAWMSVSEPNRMCTMEAWILDPKGTRTGNTELPTPLTAGRYRIVVRMTVDSPTASGAAIPAVSDPVTVQ